MTMAKNIHCNQSAGTVKRRQLMFLRRDHAKER